MSDAAPPAAARAPEGVAVDPARTARQSPWGHLVVALLALAGLVANVVGGVGFPNSAPAEWLVNAALTIDLVGVLIACGIGFGVSMRARPTEPARVFPWLGLGFSVVAAIAWVVTAGGLAETLLLGGRGRYLEDVAGVLYLGPVWSLGAIFSAYGLRGRVPWHLAAASWAGIALWGAVLAGAVASALLYAAGLTD